MFAVKTQWELEGYVGEAIDCEIKEHYLPPKKVCEKLTSLKKMLTEAFQWVVWHSMGIVKSYAWDNIVQFQNLVTCRILLTA